MICRLSFIVCRFRFTRNVWSVNSDVFPCCMCVCVHLKTPLYTTALSSCMLCCICAVCTCHMATGLVVLLVLHSMFTMYIYMLWDQASVHLYHSFIQFALFYNVSCLGCSNFVSRYDIHSLFLSLLFYFCFCHHWDFLLCFDLGFTAFILVCNFSLSYSWLWEFKQELYRSCPRCWVLSVWRQMLD